MLRIKTDSSSSDNDVRSLLLFQNTLLQILSISLAINNQLWKTAFRTLIFHTFWIFHLAFLWKGTSITLCVETIFTIPRGRQAGEIWLLSFSAEQKTESYFNYKILWLLYISFGRKYFLYSSFFPQNRKKNTKNKQKRQQLKELQEYRYTSQVKNAFNTVVTRSRNQTAQQIIFYLHYSIQLFCPLVWQQTRD